MEAVLDFLRAAEQLKNTLRSSKTSSGRQESTAEHTWRLCLMVLLLEADYPEMDMLRLLKICIVHDLGEAVGGDIAAVDQVEGVNKAVQERRDFMSLLKPLPGELQKELLELWDEYEAAVSPEARLAKALDKMETLLQHTQGQNAEDFDYGFNLSYGRNYTDLDHVTAGFRTLLDRETRRLAQENGSLPDEA
ncbi:HD domain-containing protein [Kiloniella sp. b19]|uniref:HD domain-containing protein n=1 Tax=Kiloniella sp. GXU_MW_B19 TaxID=3141326 RepID=UPI0031D05282